MVKVGLSLLVAVALAAVTAATAPATVAGRAAVLVLLGDELMSSVTVTWETKISFRGQVVRDLSHERLTTTNGRYAFAIPFQPSAPGIVVTTSVSGIQGYKSDHGKCTRPALPLEKAISSNVRETYCATIYHRSCPKVGLGWKRCKCHVTYTIRATVLDENNKLMRLTSLESGGFKTCAQHLSNSDMQAVTAMGAKVLGR